MKSKIQSSEINELSDENIHSAVQTAETFFQENGIEYEQRLRKKIYQ